MKKKKKLFILADGRIFFDSVIPFYKKSSNLISCVDINFFLNWIYTVNTLILKNIDKKCLKKL